MTTLFITNLIKVEMSYEKNSEKKSAKKVVFFNVSNYYTL